MRRGLLVTGCATIAALTAACQTPTSPPPVPFSPQIERISVSTEGTQGYSTSGEASISADGRYVVFESYAQNLVTGDTNHQPDVFVRDLSTDTTTRVSVASDGTQANHASGSAAISGDGRIVAFTSPASNLVAGDTDDRQDLFIHDRQTATTTRVLLTLDAPAPAPAVGAAAPLANAAPPMPPVRVGGVALSQDGRYVTFASESEHLVPGDTNDAQDVFLHDLATGTTTRESVTTAGGQVTGGASGGSLSADGRYLAFATASSDVVPDDTNGVMDQFVRDRHTGTTTRVSIATDGTQADATSGGGQLSADGRLVAFTSGATNLVADDTNGVHDAFTHDLDTGTTTRVSVATDGTQANASTQGIALSAEGQHVAFSSTAWNLSPVVQYDLSGTLDVFVHDRLTNATTRVSPVGGPEDWRGSWIGDGAISADGRQVTFGSNVPFLVPNDTNDDNDVFVWDRDA